MRVQDHVDAAAMLSTGSARMRLCSLIRALRATQCQISRLEDAMFAVVEHVILLRLTSPGNGWKQKCLPALQIQVAFSESELSQEIRDSLHSFECLERDQQAKAETGSAGQTASFVQRSRSEVSIWRMICHPAWFHTAPAHLPKIGFKSGKISERYRWACARAPRSRPEWASIGMIASTPTWR